MKIGDIVFAPSKTSTMWPGRILDINLMATVKFYRIKEHRKVAASVLLPFNEINISLFKEKNKSKSFSAAVKAAENDLRKQGMQTLETNSNNSRTPPKKRRDEVKVKKEHRAQIKAQATFKLQEQKLQKAIKDQEDCKAEQNQKSKIQEEKYLPEYDSIASLLLDMTQTDLVALSKIKQLREFIFYHPGLQQKIRIASNPQLELERLLEWLLSQLISQANAKIVHFYQKKVILLINIIDFSIDSILSRDVVKLITFLLQSNQNCRLHWNNNKFIQQLRKFKQDMASILDNYLEDYEQLAPIANIISKLNVNLEEIVPNEL